MNKGKTIFAQVMALVNEYEFKKCVDHYKSGLKAMPRSTLAEVNEKKDWPIYQDLDQVLIR